MSLPQKPKPAKLVIGIFLKDKTLVEGVAQDLIHHFGPIDLLSAWLPFDYTDYYDKEMGCPLFRRVFSFVKLIEQTFLADVKIITNSIEEKYSKNGSRRVNIDPGYLLLERFVLATGKNYSHRIYIGREIYADLTLIHKDGEYQKLPWTYPDYVADNMMKYLLKVRSKYAYDLKQELSDNQKERTGE
ncbi:MAG: DUF4416 family protein [Desulfobacterales bacterium]|jgi:hypothetical protein|nr:DUF4416 family protein [Desulfobacterales bacterium]